MEDNKKNIIQESINQKESEILSFKASLSGSDYQIIKRYEAHQLGLEIPYPNIIENRNIWRNQINILEQEIIQLKQEFLSINK